MKKLIAIFALLAASVQAGDWVITNTVTGDSYTNGIVDATDSYSEHGTLDGAGNYTDLYISASPTVATFYWTGNGTASLSDTNDWAMFDPATGIFYAYATRLPASTDVTIFSSDYWFADATTGTGDGGYVISHDKNLPASTSYAGDAIVRAINYGTISGSAMFLGSITQNEVGATVSGNAMFIGRSGHSDNAGAVTLSALFASGCINWGTITLNALFDNNAFNGGTITLNSVFDNYSYNGGTVGGNAMFTTGSYNNNTGGTVSKNALFDNSAYNSGTIVLNALFDAGANNTATINGCGLFNNSANNGTVAYDALFYGSGGQNGSTVSGNALFASSGRNASGATVSGDAGFWSSALNEGTVSGTIVMPRPIGIWDGTTAHTFGILDGTGAYAAYGILTSPEWGSGYSPYGIIDNNGLNWSPGILDAEGNVLNDGQGTAINGILDVQTGITYENGIIDESGVYADITNAIHTIAGGQVSASTIGDFTGTANLTPTILKSGEVVDDVTGTLVGGDVTPGLYDAGTNYFENGILDTSKAYYDLTNAVNRISGGTVVEGSNKPGFGGGAFSQ